MILIITGDGKKYKGEKLISENDEYFNLLIGDVIKARIKKNNISVIQGEETL